MKQTTLRGLAAAVAAASVALAGCSAARDPSSQGPGAGAQPARAQSAQAPGASAQGSARQGGRRFGAITVQAVSVPAGPLVTENDTAGTVVPVTQSQVAAQVSGVVLQVLRNVGDTVRAGAPVIQLDDAALKLSVANAQAALESAKINLSIGQQSSTESDPKLADQLSAAQTALTAAQKNYGSQKALYDEGGISSSQLDTAKSALDQAQANVEAAKAAVDQNSQADTQNLQQLKLAVDQAGNQLAMAQLNEKNAVVRAPFDGVISAMNVSPGMYVSVNTQAFLVVSIAKQIAFTVPPSDAATFRAGDTVQFDLGGVRHPVKLVQNPAAPINGVVPLAASVPPSLRVSYGAVGTIVYTLTVATGPQIPISALQSRANTDFVDTVVSGKAVEVPVTVVAEAGTTAVVTGVAAGDQVIINPPPGLLDGSAVQVAALPPTPGAAQASAGGRTQAAGGSGQRTYGTGQSGTRTAGGGGTGGSGRAAPQTGALP